MEQVIQRLITLIQEGKIQILKSKTNYLHVGKLTLFFVHRFISLVAKYSSSLQTTATNTDINTIFWNKIFSCLISSCGIEIIMEKKKNDKNDELKSFIQQLTQKVTSFTCSMLFNQSTPILLVETFLQTSHSHEELFLIQKLHLMHSILLHSKDKSEYIEYIIFTLLPECHPWITSHLQLFQTILNSLFQTLLKENDDCFHLIRWTFHDTHPLSRQVLITLFLLIIYHQKDPTKLITCTCQVVLDRRNEKNSMLPVILYKLLCNTKQSTIQTITQDIFLHTYFNHPNKKKKQKRTKKKKRKFILSPCKLSEKYIRTLSPLLECISSNDSFWSDKSMLSWWDESIKPFLRILLSQTNNNFSHVGPPFSMSVIWSFLTGAMKQDTTTTNQQEVYKIFFERTGFQHSSIFDLTVRLLVSSHHNDKILSMSNAIRFCQISIITMAKSNNKMKDQSLLPLIQYVNQQSRSHTSNDIVWDCIQLLSHTSSILHSGSSQQIIQVCIFLNKFAIFLTFGTFCFINLLLIFLFYCKKTLSQSFFNFLNSPLPSNWMIVSDMMTSFQKFSNGLLSGHKKILLTCFPQPLKPFLSCRVRQQQQNNASIYDYSNQKTYQVRSLS